MHDDSIKKEKPKKNGEHSPCIIVLVCVDEENPWKTLARTRESQENP